MTTPFLSLRKLHLFGPNEAHTSLSFSDSLNFIYGASNTGKSFAVKSLDFMLGGNQGLPLIDERKPYNRIRLDFSIDKEFYSLERAVVGGDFELRESNGVTQKLAHRHSSDNEHNLSNYLLNRLGVAGSRIAQDKSGTKRNLSFRDIARLCITDETSIQSEASPIETNDLKLIIAERNIFKMMLTGEDDSALISIAKPKDYRTGRTAQVQLLAEMIAVLDAELAQDYPDAETLDEEREGVEAALAALEADIVASRASAYTVLEKKRKLSTLIAQDQRRAGELSVAVENFEQLESVYQSDIARLEALEEAGFLLGLTADQNCPVCGASPEVQKHDYENRDIETLRRAAEAEIAKIRIQKSDLLLTIRDAQAEQLRLTKNLDEYEADLRALDQQLADVTPDADEQQRRFVEVLSRRDRILRGIDLIGRRNALERQRNKLETTRQERPKTNYSGGLSTQIAQEFADEVADVLTAWKFPGQCRVTFDLDTYDLIIDGKRRRDNGKGVRAITHAAFKVALLTFCRRRRNLPHPGFLILDTPLVTYRDPISSKGGALSDDERVIRNSDLKERMFDHLQSLAGVGQFILFDNADPPVSVGSRTSVEVFTNDSTEGRQGFL